MLVCRETEFHSSPVYAMSGSERQNRAHYVCRLMPRQCRTAGSSETIQVEPPELATNSGSGVTAH